MEEHSDEEDEELVNDNEQNDQIEKNDQGEEEQSVNGNNGQLIIQQEDNNSKSMEELPRNEPHSQEVQVSSPKKNPNPNTISKPNPNPNDTVAAKPISGDLIDPGDKIKDNQPHIDPKKVMQLEGNKGGDPRSPNQDKGEEIIVRATNPVDITGHVVTENVSKN